tara:strand:+ start:260 stop:1168 length:909 start_codon:yes stop_codon:yes gene_type:complete
MEGPPGIQGSATAAPDTSVDLTDFLRKIVDKSKLVNEMRTGEDYDIPVPPNMECYIKSGVIQQSILTLCHAVTKPALVPKAAEAGEQAEAEQGEAREYRDYIREIHEAGYKDETLPSVYPPTLNQDIAKELNEKVKSTKKAAEAAVKEADNRRIEAKGAKRELEKRFNNFRNGLVKFDDTTLDVIRQLGISPSPLAALLQVCEFLMMDDDVMDPLLRFVASLVSIDPKTLSEDIFMVAQPDASQEASQKYQILEAIQKYQILQEFNEDLTGGDTDLEGRLAQVIDPDRAAATQYEQKARGRS